MDYMVVIEKTGNGFSAYVPDVPGCIAAADTVSEVEQLIRETIVLHLELLTDCGETIPEPATSSAIVRV